MTPDERLAAIAAKSAQRLDALKRVAEYPALLAQMAPHVADAVFAAIKEDQHEQKEI